MIRIAVVEDDENIQKLITYALGANGYEARGYLNGEAFLRDTADFVPALVLLDIMMPGMDGIEVLKRLRKSPKFRNLPVMMLTAKSSEIDKVRALDLGADDYVTKPFGVMELLSRVKALLRRASQTLKAEESNPYARNTAVEPLKPILQFQSIRLDENRHLVEVEENGVTEKPELTLKEFELLSYMLHNQGLVLSREQMLEKVWNYEYTGESRTVDMHIKSLRQKLGGAGRFILTVRGLGYRLAEPGK